MKRKINILAGDKALWVVFFLLSVISLIAVYSTVGRLSSTPSKVFFKHLFSVVAAYGVVIVLSHINYRCFSKWFMVFYWISIGLLVVALAIGTDGRWLSLPIVKSVQPSEIAKVVLVVVLARKMTLKQDKIDEQGTFFELVFPVILVCALIFTTNLSTALLIGVVSYIMFWFGGVNKPLLRKCLFIVLSLCVVFGLVIYYMGETMDVARSATWAHRFDAWIHPNPDELSQENMARMAIARGGMFGNGIGTTIHGRLMTQSESDFIFAIIIEEVGLIPSIFIMMLYTFFFFRCIKIVTRTKGLFGSLCVAGMGTMIFLQAMINIGVATGVMPVTGQTLPFISHGGSSYVCMGVGLGVIQSVAAYNKKAELAEAEKASAPKTGNTAPEPEAETK